MLRWATHFVSLAAAVLCDDTFNLSGRRLTSLGLQLADGSRIPPTVKRLDASNNQITTLQQDLGQLTQLEELVLDVNNIDSIPCVPVLRKLTNLKLLSLRKQKVGEYKILINIDSWLSSCSSLRELYLSSNKITQVPTELKALKGLRVLELSDNELQNIPGVVLREWVNMEYLNLGRNKLRELPEEIGHMRSLIVLRLSDNQLISLPNSICSLTRLQTLTLFKNSLVYLPFEFYKLKGLLRGPEAAYFVQHLDMTFPPGFRVGENPGLIYPPMSKLGGDIKVIFDFMRDVHRNPREVQTQSDRIHKALDNCQH